jgi:hypothetical protein
VPPAENEAAPAADAGAGSGDTVTFGDMEGIDLTQAGTSVGEAQAYFEGLEASQQDDVRERCAEADAGAAGQADAAAGTGATFCANLKTAGLLEEAQ